MTALIMYTLILIATWSQSVVINIDTGINGQMQQKVRITNKILAAHTRRLLDADLPTTAPSEAPTPSPTLFTPTAASPSPTNSPSSAPTPSPIPTTFIPTTKIPTNPSFIPTFRPSMSPSAIPTKPSANPTIYPTIQSTSNPTTFRPTADPTSDPSVIQTFSPTISTSIVSLPPTIAFTDATDDVINCPTFNSANYVTYFLVGLGGMVIGVLLSVSVWLITRCIRKRGSVPQMSIEIDTDSEVERQLKDFEETSVTNQDNNAFIINN